LLVSCSTSHGSEFSFSCSALVVSLKSDLWPAQELVRGLFFRVYLPILVVGLVFELLDLKLEFF
jgi:hypothetical protein